MSDRTDMTTEEVESFLTLWERAIQLSDPNRRDAMEAERAGIWTAETQSRRLARSVLSDLQRNANLETDAGRELAEACAALRRALDPAPSAQPAVRPALRPRAASTARAGAPNTPAWSAPLESLRRSPKSTPDAFHRPPRKAKR